MIGTAAAYVFPPLGLVACFAASALLIKWLLERRQVGEWRRYAPLPFMARLRNDDCSRSLPLLMDKRTGQRVI
jgi:hypothetical protein